MSIQAADLRKLVKIVRQYEVIYGGGISSGDAAIREECENLVGLLESELGGKKRGSARGAASLPSLVDARKKPKESGASRPMTSRASELATLTTSKPAEKKPAPSPKVASKGATAVAKGKAPAAKTTARGKAPAASAGKVGKKAASKGKPSSPPPKAGAGKPSTATPATARHEEHSVYKDVRSRHAEGAKAAALRANRIAGDADDSGEIETKKHFAALHLFDAFQKNRLPKYGGFIVCVRFADDKGYTIIEIIGYENMQDLYPEGDTLVFKSVGCKLYAVVEPSGYLFKSVEPVNRPSDQMIPYRFSELLRITTKRFQGILIGRKPVFMPTSFSVFKPAGEDLAILFYNIADVYSNIQDFIIMILRDRLGLPVVDSRKAAEGIARGIREFRLWMDEG